MLKSKLHVSSCLFSENILPKQMFIFNNKAYLMVIITSGNTSVMGLILESPTGVLLSDALL